MTDQEIPKHLIAAFVPRGYFIPAYLIWLYLPLYGKEASEANRKLVDGETVRLEFDVQQLDKYGRTLAYIYLEEGTFVNAWLVENGYAMVMTIPPNVKHQELFLKLQREAREGRRGCGDDAALPYHPWPTWRYTICIPRSV